MKVPHHGSKPRPRRQTENTWSHLYVRDWREHRGLKQKELAALAAISESLLSQIEAGLVNGSPETLEKLARALGVSLGVLFDVKPKANHKVVQYLVSADAFPWVHNMAHGAGAELISVTEE